MDDGRGGPSEGMAAPFMSRSRSCGLALHVMQDHFAEQRLAAALGAVRFLAFAPGFFCLLAALSEGLVVNLRHVVAPILKSPGA